ncbi:MAG TPA: hypothetical protein VMW65_05745 [Chloroflexota bacterium]|nr:hypothetical protein [Chloroflexota bacterium]
MPKKNSGKAARSRVHRAPRVGAAIPVESSAPAVTPAPTAARPTASAAPYSAPSRPSAGSSRVPSAVRSARPRSTGLTMINDYSYVGADLRRIAMLAGGAFVVLIGLTFVIH